MNIKVTIAICTWNRSQSLRSTLDSIARMIIPKNVVWELIVVNNASKDDTACVASSFSSKLPINVVYEGQAGLSYARNKAIECATGDYIIFTDDDVLVDEKWLSGYCDAFYYWPNAVVFGGPIEPIFEGTTPEYIIGLMDTVGYIYGRQTFGSSIVKLNLTNISKGPFGGNMAFSKSVLNSQSFDVDLGTKGSQYNVGEESKLIRAIISCGAEGWWIPSAKIQHVIPRKSQNMRYVRRWLSGAGRHDEIIGNQTGSKSASAVLLLSRVIKNECYYFIKRPFYPAHRWIGHVINSSKARGRLLYRYSYMLRKENRK